MTVNKDFGSLVIFNTSHQPITNGYIVTPDYGQEGLIYAKNNLSDQK